MTDVGQPQVIQAKVLNPFNIQEYPTDKEIRLDVLVEDETKARYNIEVQKESHTGFLERMLFGWAETYGAMMQRGQYYDLLCPVRCIIITEFPIFQMLKRLHAVFELRARENPDVLFSDHCQMHVLRLGDLLRNNIGGNKLSGLDQFGLDLQRWMQFWALGAKLEEAEMSAMLQDCPPVQAASEEFYRFRSDPEMREKVRARERFLNDQRVQIGLQLAGAKKEGIAEGRTETARETAATMKQKGYPTADIAEMTGLPLSEIERLG
jgi:predicted transposase/invertase (TIGR01784 family)